MDVQTLFSAGMRTCGRVLKVLPQEEIGSPIQYMQTILREETLPSLNILLPRLLTKKFPIYALTRVEDGDNMLDSNVPGIDNRYSAFRVPESIVEGAPIQGIKSYCLTSAVGEMHDHSGFGIGMTFPNRYGRYSSANLYEASLASSLRYADAQLIGTMVPTLRMKFFQPNVLWINKPYADDDDLFITVTFKIQNDENLITVPDSAYEGVKELFILDLKKSIYNEYGMFSELETPYGTVNLKIDDWSSAEADRNQLYKDYLATAHYRNTAMMS